MKNLRVINWNPQGMTKDERAYLRGQVKLLDRLGVLQAAPLWSVELRDKVQDYLSSVVAVNSGNRDYGRPYPGDTPSRAKQDANQLLALIGQHVERVHDS